MKTHHSLICGAAALVILVATASVATPANSREARAAALQKQSGSSPTGNPQNGKTVYESLGCNRCHGSEGEGLSSAGVPRIASTALAMSDFVRQIRKPKGQMPPFSSQKASDADLADVYAYLQSLKPAAEQPAASAANSTKGERLFKSYGCYECHGLRGQGSTSTGGSRLGPPRIPLSAFVSYVREPGGQMPPYAAKAVSDQDLSEIYTFLKSIPPPPPAKSIPLLNQ